MAAPMSRSKAADKLLKGLPKQDEEDPMAAGAPAPEMPPPPGGDAAMEGMETPGAPDEMPEEAGVPPEGAMDLDSALAGVEAAIDGMPEDAAREIRTHLEAIKDIAASQGDQKTPASPDAAAGPSNEPTPDTMPPAPGLGMDERG